MSTRPLGVPNRFSSPDRLPEATAFSKDREVSGSMAMVRIFKSQSRLLAELRSGTDVDKNWGRRREPGTWALAYVAFVASGHVDIQPWLDSTTGDLWRACEFPDGKPTYKRVWRRFRELEHHSDAFLTVVATLVQRARSHDKRVGAHVHVDGTEDETNAALVHDCQPGEKCARPPEKHSCGRGFAGGAQRPQRAPTHTAREHRQKLAEEPVVSDDDPCLFNPKKVKIVVRDGREIKRIKAAKSGCWYRTLDLDAGIRLYSSERGATRFWHGYNNQKMIDHFTGGVLYAGVYNASIQEFDMLPDAYDQVKAIVGAAPETMIGDRGYSMKTVFEHLTKNGTAPVFPWRKPGGGDGARHDFDTYDRHGVPRCKHCGGPTTFVRFSANNGKPRLWYRCSLDLEPACAREQSRYCSDDYKLLLPLWRTEPLYFELKESHQSYEATHDWWRDRYKVAATGNEGRIKIRGIGVHQLRANTAAAIEWLRICFREGWLGTPRRNYCEPQRTGALQAQADWKRFAGMRARMGLLAAYGAKAGERDPDAKLPPSRRPKRHAVGAPAAPAP